MLVSDMSKGEIDAFLSLESKRMEITYTHILSKMREISLTNHVFWLCSAICLNLGSLQGVLGDYIDMTSRSMIKSWCSIVEMETQQYLSSKDKYDDG
jgi:hypothetical protein